MSAATIPLSTSTRQAPTWEPSDKDRLIFKWVKFDGHTQSWVADQLNINQATVSRIVERYERWIARGGPDACGGMTREERIRFQRWMTYQRNELIIAACLRLAAEMERGYDTSKSNILRHAAQPSLDLEVRTEYKVIDRSANAARFLRLAHRIGLEQLKLVEQDDLEPLPPLTIDDFDPALDEALAQVFAFAQVPEDPTPYPAPLSREQTCSRTTVVAGSPDPTTTTVVAGSPDPTTPSAVLGVGLPTPPTPSAVLGVGLPTPPTPSDRQVSPPATRATAASPTATPHKPSETKPTQPAAPTEPTPTIHSLQLTSAASPVHKMHNAKPQKPTPTPYPETPYQENPLTKNFPSPSLPLPLPLPLSPTPIHPLTS